MTSPPDLSRAVRWLTAVPSVVTIGFGAWHFTVPTTWNWYGAIAPEATELVLAVRAVNVFFSLTLVLLGVVTLVLAVRRPVERFALSLLVGASCVLWATRVGMQLAFPQGTQVPGLAAGLLTTFLAVFILYAAALALHLKARA